MTSTYISWNGEELPWPPPENWYRAQDGRWWHPAYGPDDPPDEPAVDPQSTSQADTDPEPSPNYVRRPAGDDAEDSITVPVGIGGEEWVDTIERSATDHARSANSADSIPDEEPTLDFKDKQEIEVEIEPEVEAEAEPEVEVEDRRGGADDPDHHPDNPPAGATGNSRRQWVIAAIIGGLILVPATVAQVMYGSASTDLATTEEGSESSVVDSTPSTATSAGDLPATTAEAESTTADPPADPEVAVKVTDFRARLEQHELATSELSDHQITTFASTYCVYATGAEDRAAFDDLRQVAVTTSESDLTPEQLNVTITTAIMVFCPEESQRLGINYETSP